MSDFEKKPKRPPSPSASDDPWAKWRKPTDAASADDAAPAASTEEGTAPAVNAEKPVENPWEQSKPKARPSGTLSLSNRSPVVRTPSRGPVRSGGPAKPFNKPAKAPSTVKVAVVDENAEPRPRGEGVRLSKVMSERGLCSRREADLWIERGWIFVDGEQVSELGTRINPDAKISISREAELDQAKQVTILLHKPVGYVSGQPEPGSVPAVTLIKDDNQVVQSGDPEFKPWMLRGLAPAGRLDVDSTGLLVLTSDGRVAKRLIGEDSEAEKEYLVRVSGEMIPRGLELLNHGLELDEKPLKPARVKQLNEDQLHFILKEGKKRQIRRMCELVGLRVIGLKRVRIGRVKLGDLPMGQWRFLRADEAF